MRRLSRQTKKYITTVILAVAAVTFLPSATNAQDDNTILGAGSTFVYPLFSKQFSEYNKKTGIQVNYQSIGSGGGILQLTNKTVDFGDSDAPLNDEQTTKMGAPVIHIPICSGAVVITYNLPGINVNLKFTPDVLADIYLGKITSWNDSRISSLNKGINIPSIPILIVHRSDGSGTTNIFTNYLSKVSPEWKEKVGSGGAVNWPSGLGGKGNEGVSGLVKQTPGGIGYVELAYAIQNKMPNSIVMNKKGKYIAPSTASVSAAGNVILPGDAKIFITDTDAADGYPISGFTWALIYKEQNYNGRSMERAKKLLQLLWWDVHEGQQYAPALNYAPLSKQALAVAENNLKSVTFNNQKIL